MSWIEPNPFFTFYYPFYDYPINFHIYQPTTTITNYFSQQKQSENYESIKNIGPIDTQTQLSSDKIDSKDELELKKKSVRKQRILKRRVKSVLLQERQDNFQRKKQKKDRNLPSNVFKYFISYIYNHPNLSSVLAGLPKDQLSVNPTTFVFKLKQIIKQSQSYIRPSVIQQFCYESSFNKSQTLAFRRVLKRFLLMELPALVGPMQKYKKQQRRELINLGRRLFQQIKQKAF